MLTQEAVFERKHLHVLAHEASQGVCGRVHNQLVEDQVLNAWCPIKPQNHDLVFAGIVLEAG